MNLMRNTSWQKIATPEALEQINQENRMAIRLLARVGIPLSIANYFAQSIIFSTSPSLTLQKYWLLVYFVSLLLLERYLLPKKCRCATILLYLIESPVMVVSILLGTVWDPSHQALTILLFLMAMPVFILDRPLRLAAIFTGWTAAFLVTCLLVKDPATHKGDFFHTVEFYLATAAVTYVVLRVRLSSLQNLERTRFHLEHDELTGTRNRRSLLSRTERYVNRPMIVLTAHLDQLDLYNDFFGREVGDEMLVACTQAVVEQFGEADSYRVGGDEVLCMLREMDLETCMERMEKCRRALCRRTFHDHTLTMNLAFGYVTGTAEDYNALSEMVQLSNIYAHKAQNIGRDQTVGGHYSKEQLQAAIVESNVAPTARVYETNQLTGLPSMSWFITHSDELMQTVVIRERNPMIGYFNLLHFREFNDAFGYTQGDNLIRCIARLLQSGFPNRSICCISGSNFGLMVYEDEIEDGLRRVSQALLTYKKDYPLYCKAGFAAFNGEESAISLLDRARLAHDSIRNRPEVSYRIYDEQLDEEIHFRQYLVTHVDQAVEENWLRVYYQPIVRSVNGKVCNEEALSRWVDPQYGFLPPYRFIPTLEENRLIYKVSLHVVRTVLADFKRKEAAGIPLVPVSVNLSRHDFEQCDMVEEITRLVDASGYPRRLLKIEITESAFTKNAEQLTREVDKFRSNGFEVWMDDFGSEYSTLNLLQNMNFDLIKIDMEFMKNYSASGKNSIIVSDIIDMARQLGITTLIEGIETEEHYRLLRDMGCEKLQGFYFDRPNPLEEVLKRCAGDNGGWFEHYEEAVYFCEVGRVDLVHPLSGRGAGTPFTSETPAGVLELCPDGSMRCLRSSSSFLNRLVDLELVLRPALKIPMPPLVRPLPEPLLQAARKGAQEQDWVSLNLPAGQGRSVTCYLIRVAEHGEEGSIALLTVFLPGHQG